MKVVCIYGSPRPKGNSATIANWILEKGQQRGNDIQSYYLNKLVYRGCQACMACKMKIEQCVVNDDLTGVLEAIRHTDVLIMATPIYFADITAQLKGLIDRMYSYFVPDFLTNPKPSRLSSGKKLIYIQTQAQPSQEMFLDVFQKYELFLRMMGFTEIHLIRGCGVRDLGEVDARNDIHDKAIEIAQSVFG